MELGAPIIRRPAFFITRVMTCTHEALNNMLDEHGCDCWNPKQRLHQVWAPAQSSPF